MAVQLFLPPGGFSVRGIAQAPADERFRFFLSSPSEIEYRDGVNIFLSANQADAGVLAGGSIVQGAAVNGGANIGGLAWYAGKGSSGAVVLEALNGATNAYNYSNWIATGTLGFGASTLMGFQAFPIALCFRTTARWFGVAGGNAGGATVDVWVNEGARFQRCAQNPLPHTGGRATLYFDLGSNADRTFVVIVTGSAFYALCAPTNQRLEWEDFKSYGLIYGALTDSIQSPALITRLLFRSFACVLNGDGGTGYVKPLVLPATANSNLDATAATTLSSLSGNIGWLPGHLPGGDQASSNDGHVLVDNELAPVPLSSGRTGARTTSIIQGQPEVVMITAGLNDYTEAASIDPANAGWSFLSAVTAVLARLRDALPDTLLIVQSPYTGENRGASGYAFHEAGGVNAKFTEIPSQLDAITGPWLFQSTVGVGGGFYVNQWTCRRSDGSEFNGTQDPVPWMRGTGNITTPDGNGNADDLMNDSVHPTEFSTRTLTAPATLNQIPVNLEMTNVNVSPSGTVSLQPAASPPIAYGDGVTVTYTGKNVGSLLLTGCTILAGEIEAEIGDKVYPLGEFGSVHYAIKSADSIANAFTSY